MHTLVFSLVVDHVGVSAVLCTPALNNELPKVSMLLAVSFSHTCCLWWSFDAQIESTVTITGRNQNNHTWAVKYACIPVHADSEAVYVYRMLIHV